MARKGYKITQAVRDRLTKARAAIKPKQRDPNALKPGDPKYRGRVKKFRRTHKVYRNKCRRKNYSSSRPRIRKNRPWTEWEIGLVILSTSETDRALAESMGRSVQALQQKRYMLKCNR